ncbi:MAG: hypothetical protein WA129_05505 [Acidovorax sp.]
MSSSSSSEQALPVHATVAQQKVLDRIAVQRVRLRARRAARLQSRALAAAAGTEGADAPFLARAVVFARQHPVATVAALAGVAGVVIAAGPRRLIRWAGIALPLVMRLRC